MIKYAPLNYLGVTHYGLPQGYKWEQRYIDLGFAEIPLGFRRSPLKPSISIDVSKIVIVNEVRALEGFKKVAVDAFQSGVTVELETHDGRCAYDDQAIETLDVLINEATHRASAVGKRRVETAAINAKIEAQMLLCMLALDMTENREGLTDEVIKFHEDAFNRHDAGEWPMPHQYLTAKAAWLKRQARKAKAAERKAA